MSRGASLGQRWEAVAGVMHSRDLRRLQFGWASYNLVDGLALVALSVWAFREGGAATVGIVGLARLLPGALALPFGAWAADRFSRRRLVTAVFLAMTLTQLAIANILVLDVPVGVVYALVALASIASAPYRPAHLALVPLVSRTPEELVAMNVTAGTLDGLASFLGPAIAAVLLLVVQPEAVVAVAGVAALLGYIAVSAIRLDADRPRAGAHEERPLESLLGGFAELRRNRDVGVIVGCFIVQLLVRGVLGVLAVSVSFDLIDTGSSGVGWLAAAMGVGGIIGAVFAVTLTGRRRLGGPFAAALAIWGAPIALIGAIPNTVVAVLAMAAVGLGNAILDVSGFTLIQRLGVDRALGRVFGVLFTVGVAIGGIASVVAPALVSSLGLRVALIATGCLLPLLSLVLLPRFRSIDARSEPPAEVVGMLAAVPFLSPVAPTTVEKLASHATVIERGAGDVIVQEGDVGDLFYVVAEGEVEVTTLDGRVRRTLGAGQPFGEIALLRARPRTATVIVTRPTRLVTIDGRDFVDALSSSESAFSLGQRTTDDYLHRDESARADRSVPGDGA